MRNRLTYTFLFTLLVAAGLLLLGLLPPLRIGETVLRRVDALSMLRPDKKAEVPQEAVMPVDTLIAQADTAAIQADTLMQVKKAYVASNDTVPGITIIEEFPDSNGEGGMADFYEALANIDHLGRPVRVAYFGDSFIEGDILTADLRAMLQKRFGGCGVGYVPVTNKHPHYRPTVTHTFAGWESHVSTDSKDFRDELQDISGHYFFPAGSGKASVTLRGQHKYATLLDTCEVSSFYFVSPDSVVITASVNGKEVKRFELAGDSAMQVLSVEGRIGRVEWAVEQADTTARFFAASMDSHQGIAVDNFNTRGSNGMKLMSIPLETLKEFDKLRTYDLIVLQYGLNVASDKLLDYTYYKIGMVKVLRHLKQAFPNTSILIVGVSDRDTRDKDTGELRTMPGVRELTSSQRWLAVDTNVAFWNLFEAMGGESSIKEMAEGNPQMANFDYTHINFLGGRHLAKALYKAIVYGSERYKEQTEYED